MDSPQDVFDDIARRLAAEPQRTAGMTARYQFDVAGDGGGSWTLDVDDGRAAVRDGAADSPDVIVLMEAGDFVDLANGRLDGQEAFMEGLLRVRGHIGKAMLLANILG